MDARIGTHMIILIQLIIILFTEYHIDIQYTGTVLNCYMMSWPIIPEVLPMMLLASVY